MVNLFQTAPEGFGNSIPSADGEDNDFLFPSSTLQSIGPEEDDIFVDVTIFEDGLPEVTEAAQLRLSLLTDGMFPRFEILPQYPSFFIIIEDDDREFISTHCKYHFNTNFQDSTLASRTPRTQLTNLLEC